MDHRRQMEAAASRQTDTQTETDRHTDKKQTEKKEKKFCHSELGLRKVDRPNRIHSVSSVTAQRTRNVGRKST